jgi:two-component system, OmpR family, phosphate regulon sensor histidine kinase PhoR
MGWFLLICAIAFGALWFRSFTIRWRRLETLVDDLAAGNRPVIPIFRRSRRFSSLVARIEKIGVEKDRLRRRIEDDRFNLEAILASMVEGVMVLNLDHTIRFVNESFTNMFSLRINPVGETVLAALRDVTIEETVCATLEGDQAQVREISMLTRGPGQPSRYFAVSAMPLRDPGGAANGVLMVFHDVTRLRNLEEVRREFIANVSHELRTPLSIFHGYLENVMDDPEMPQTQLAGIFEIMRKHSMRLNALLEDLLSLARLESRAEKIECAPIEVESLLRHAVQDWKLRLGEKNLGVEVRIAPEGLVLEADPFRIEQVLNNLLENAVKFSNRDGSIILHAGVSDHDVILRVQDNGAGIPPAARPHIFEPFYRAEKARTREAGGTGLGLSIVKRIVDLHGGTVTAESTLGEGTTITVCLPAQPAASRPLL